MTYPAYILAVSVWECGTEVCSTPKVRVKLKSGCTQMSSLWEAGVWFMWNGKLACVRVRFNSLWLYICSGKPIYAPPLHHRSFPACRPCVALSRPFKEESNTLYASPLQVIDIVMPLALCLQVLSPALSTEIFWDACRLWWLFFPPVYLFRRC